jgi:hypothetical protein
MFSINHTIGQWNVGIISSVLDVPALSASKAAYSYNEVGFQAVYDLGKGARLYVTNANKGVATGLGNFTEVGFIMGF